MKNSETKKLRELSTRARAEAMNLLTEMGCYKAAKALGIPKSSAQRYITGERPISTEKALEIFEAHHNGS